MVASSVQSHRQVERDGGVSLRGVPLGSRIEALRGDAAWDAKTMRDARSAAAMTKIWEWLFGITLLGAVALAVAGLFTTGSLLGVFLAVCCAAPVLYLFSRGLTWATAAQRDARVVDRHIAGKLVLPLLERLAPAMGLQTPIHLEVAPQVRAGVRFTAEPGGGVRVALEIVDRESLVDGALRIDRQLVVTRTGNDGDVVEREQTTNLRNLFPLAVETLQLPDTAWQRMVDDIVAFIDPVFPVTPPPVSEVVVESLPTPVVCLAGRLQGAAPATRWLQLLDDSKRWLSPRGVLSVALFAAAVLSAFFLGKVVAVVLFGLAFVVVVALPPRGQQHETLLRPLARHAVDRFGAGVWLRVDSHLEPLTTRPDPAGFFERFVTTFHVSERPILAVDIGHATVRGWEPIARVEVVDAVLEDQAAPGRRGRPGLKRRATRLIRVTAPSATTAALVETRRVKLESPSATGLAELLDAVDVALARR